MQRLKSITIIFLLSAFGLLTPVAQAKSPSLLLQEGLYAEETEGNLEKAINLYEQVLEQYKDVERLAARATYQLGMCHLKKGEKEKAAEYFQEVVDYYPEQKAVVEKAQAQLDKIKPSSEQDIQTQLISYLCEQHKQAYKEAKKTGIKLNSIAYYVDEACVKTQGGFITFENDTGTIIDSEITVGNFSRKNITEFYNEKLELQQIRFEDTGKSMGRYALKWTPDRVINPGEILTLLYKTSEEPLLKIDNGCRLEMTNHFGSEVLENFFLILPANMKIANGLDNLTSHKKINNFDIYLWQKRVAKNTTNSKILDIEINKDYPYPDAAKPVVVDSFPVTYSNDIDADINEITVTFDQDMFQHGWAWCRTGSPEIYPEIVGKPRYVDSRTCALPVKVAPGKAYLIIINAPPYNAFKNTEKIPAREYAVVFATKDIYGNPTKIPADLLKKAEDINARNAVLDPVLDIVPAAVRAYIADKLYETHDKAQEKGLRTNSHVHIIDQDFNRHFGMVQIFKNSTGQVIDHEISMGSNDSPEMYIYDEKGVRQKIRTFKVPNSNYRYFWTPSEPIRPDETRMLFYSAGTSKLNVDQNHQCTLRMQNHYGSPVIEDFYVVLSSNIELTYQSEPFTSLKTIEGFNIYCWSKEVPANTNHVVNVALAAGKQSTKPLKLESAPWVDGEVMELRLKRPAGNEYGTIIYSAQSNVLNGKNTWQIISHTYVTEGSLSQYTFVETAAESFVPVYGQTTNWMGNFVAEYNEGNVKLTIGTEGQKNTRDIPVDKIAYDNEQAIYLIRRMPLAEGYEGSFPIFSVQGGVTIECRIKVLGTEDITVEAGTFKCYKTDLTIYMDEVKTLQHTLWFSADEHKYLVKYDVGGSATMELAKTWQKDKDKPLAFENEEPAFSVNIPADWRFYNHGSGPQTSLQLIPPELKSWALLIWQKRGTDADSESAMTIAKADCGKLKGFFENYATDETSWKEYKINGLEAARYFATYQDKGGSLRKYTEPKEMVEYRTYIVDESNVYWFVFRVEKGKFEQQKSDFDKIISSFDKIKK